MLKELDLLLEGTPSDAPASRYQQAIVEGNLLGKTTRSSRLKTAKYLAALYGLDRTCALFRLLRYYWEMDQAARPMLALLAASGRDSLLREFTDYVLAVPQGHAVSASEIAQALGERYPARFGSTTLYATAQRFASSWTQAGYLTGKVMKRRTRPVVTPVVTSFALVLGYMTGLRGRLLLESSWTRLLDSNPAEIKEFVTEASKLGWLRLKTAGSVVEITFPGVLTPAEERLTHEPG